MNKQSHAHGIASQARRRRTGGMVDQSGAFPPSTDLMPSMVTTLPGSKVLLPPLI